MFAAEAMSCSEASHYCSSEGRRGTGAEKAKKSPNLYLVIIIVHNFIVDNHTLTVITAGKHNIKTLCTQHYTYSIKIINATCVSGRQEVSDRFNCL